jgi:hypothetical protein
LLRCEKIDVIVLERAKFARPGAFIGEVDISVYNKRDIIPAALLPQRIGQAKEAQGLLPYLFQFTLIGI